MSEFDNKYAEVLSHFTEPDVPLNPDALLDDNDIPADNTAVSAEDNQDTPSEAEDISDAAPISVPEEEQAKEDNAVTTPEAKAETDKRTDDNEEITPENAPSSGDDIVLTPLSPETEANVIKRPSAKLPWKKIVSYTVLTVLIISLVLCIPKPQKEEKVNLFTDSMVSFAKMDSGSLMNLYGVVNKRGKTVVKPLYSMTFLPGEDVILAAEGSESVTFYTGSGAKLALVSKKGEEITDFVLDDASGKFSEKVMAASKDDKWGFIDKKGKWKIKPKYAGAYNFSEGLAGVRNKDNLLWGFVNGKGKKLIDFEYQEVGEFRGGIAPVKLEDKWGFIDRKGKLIIKNRFADVGAFRKGLALAQNTKGKWGFINKKGKWVVKPAYDELRAFSESLSAAKKDGKWGYIDKKGRWVIKNSYLLAGSFSEGMAYIQNKKGFSYIDKKGKTALGGNYETASDFSRGIALVKTKNGFGYINKKGEKITKDKFHTATPFFDDGYAVVCETDEKSTSGEKWYVVNRRGKKIFKKTFDSMY